MRSSLVWNRENGIEDKLEHKSKIIIIIIIQAYFDVIKKHL